MTALEQFIAALAAQIVHERGWTVAEANRWVHARIAEAREEYRQAGAPLGDTDEGFIAWLSPRHQPPIA
jgi:hypothetical protein